MENLPQNENNTPNEEFSTIFSDPTVHNKTVKKGKSPRFFKALTLVLVVAVIVGAIFAVVKFIPETEEEDPSVENSIEVLDYGDYDIKEVTVANKNGSFNIYSKTVEADDESTGETISETYWYLKGYDKELTDSTALQAIVDMVVDIDAIRIIDSKKSSECGLDKPVATAEIITNEGKKHTVKVGAKSPDNAGVYITLSDNENIYLVGGALDEELTFTDLDCASTDAQLPITLDKKYKEYLSDDTIIEFDTITVSGSAYPEDIVIVHNKDEELAAFIPYYLTSPMQRAAENGDPVFAIFSQGFPVAGAYSYDAKPSTLKKFGLDKPDFKVEAKFADYTYSYSFKNQGGGYYAVVGTDSKNVKKVSIDECTFLNYVTTDFYNKIVYITPIDMLSNLKIENADGTYDFSIAAAGTQEGESSKYIVECNGKTYNSTYFQSFYQMLCGLEGMDFEVSDIKDKPVLTLSYFYNDKSRAPTVVEFVKVNATKYQYSVDGVPMGRIGSTSYNKINRNLERLLEGKQIVVN